MRSAALIIIAALVVTASAGAADEKEIAALYKHALAGDKAAVEKCIGALENAVKEQPSNQRAHVYLGSAYTLRSRDLPYGPAKLSALRLGLATMDAAVSAAPDDAKVRLVRALTTDSLPFFLGRKKSTRDDFIILGRMAREKPDQLSADDLHTIYEHEQILDSGKSTR